MEDRKKFDIDPKEKVFFEELSEVNKLSNDLFSHVYEIDEKYEVRFFKNNCLFGNQGFVKKLFLKNLNIKTIPNSISNLKNLESLNLEGNLIKEIPDTLSYLKNLKFLNLSGNSIKTIPDPIQAIFGLYIVYPIYIVIENFDKSLSKKYQSLSKKKQLEFQRFVKELYTGMDHYRWAFSHSQEEREESKNDLSGLLSFGIDICETCGSGISLDEESPECAQEEGFGWSCTSCYAEAKSQQETRDNHIETHIEDYIHLLAAKSGLSEDKILSMIKKTMKDGLLITGMPPLVSLDSAVNWVAKRLGIDIKELNP